MQVILGKTAGFCLGVQNAVNKATEELEKQGNIYCLGELVHNKQIINILIQKGMIFINDIEEAKGKTIIRAHGVEKKVYEKAKEKGIEILDLTCPKVLYVHKLAEEYIEKGYYIFFTGEKEHPETIGTVSFCAENYSIIEEEDDIKGAIQNFKKSKNTNVALISQTTFNLEKFNRITNKIKEQIKEENLEIKNTICNATRLRQEETASIAKEVDAMIIIGGKHSSNTNKLNDIAKEFCNNVFFIETKEELNLEKINKFEKIGIMAGASTPQKSINDLVDIIKELC